MDPQIQIYRSLIRARDAITVEYTKQEQEMLEADVYSTVAHAHLRKEWKNVVGEMQKRIEAHPLQQK